MTILIIILCLFSLLLVGVPVAFALGSIGLGMLIIGGFSPLMAPQAVLSTLDGFILLAVPLFLLMSNVLLRGGVGRDLFSAVQAWVGHWPGGLAVATVTALFAGYLAYFMVRLSAVLAENHVVAPLLASLAMPFLLSCSIFLLVRVIADRDR